VRYRAPRWLTIAIVVLLLVSAAGFILVRSAGFRFWVKRTAERSLSALVPGEFRADAVDVDVTGGVSVRGLRFTDAEGEQVMSVRLAEVRWSWPSVLLGRPLVREARLEGWTLHVEPLAKTIRSSGGKRTRRAGVFAVERLLLENGRVTWIDAEGEPVTASVDASLSWGRTPQRDEVNLLGIATHGALEIHRGAGSLTITDDEVVLHKIRLWTAHGELEGSGSTALPEGALTGEFSLTDVDLGTVARLARTPTNLEGSLSARVDASGTTLEPQIESAGRVEDAVVANVPLGRFSVSMRGRPGTLELDLPDLSVGGAEARVHMALTPRRTEAELLFEGVDLREALPDRGSRLPRTSLTGSLAFSRESTPAASRAGEFTLALQAGRVGSLRFDEVAASGRLERGGVTVESCQAVVGSTTIEAAGRSDGRTLQGRLTAEGMWTDVQEFVGTTLGAGRFVCEADLNGRLTAPRVDLVWSGEDLQLGPAKVAQTTGVGAGTWPDGFDVTAAWSDGARIGHLTMREGAVRCHLGPDGVRDATCDVNLGSAKRLSVEVDIGWSRGRVRAQLRRFVLDAQSVNIALTRPASWSVVRGELRMETPLELRLHERPLLVVTGDSTTTRVWAEVDSLKALGSLAGHRLLQDGSLSVEATITGKLRAPSGRAEVHARGLLIAGAESPASADLTLQMDSGVVLGGGRVAVGDELTASLEGRLEPRNGGAVWSAEPSGWLLMEDAPLPAVQRLIDEIGNVGLDKIFLAHSGRATFRARAEPGQWEGSLEVEDAEVTVHEINTRFERVTGSALLNRHGMRVLHLGGAVGDGEATMSGMIPWAEGGIGEFVLDIAGRAVELAPGENIRMKGNPAVTFRRSGSFLRLEGDVPLDEALVEGAFWEGGGTGPSRALWDLALWAPGRAWIRTDNADVETSLDIRVRRQGRDYAIEGTVEALRGKLHYLGRHFDITEGTLQFRGRTPPDPLVSVHSTTIIRPTSADGEEVVVNFGVEGSLLEPEIVLSSDPAGYTHEQLVAMLVLDLSPEEAQDMTTVLSQELAAAMQGILASEFAKVIRKEAGLDALYLESPGPGQDPAEVQLLVGKYLTPDLYVSVGKELLSSSLDNVKVEYLLHRARAGKKRLDLRLVGSRDKDQEYGQYQYNADLKLRYRF
jgi:autotransporter translocation and assembly factor TamB